MSLKLDGILFFSVGIAFAYESEGFFKYLALVIDEFSIIILLYIFCCLVLDNTAFKMVKVHF